MLETRYRARDWETDREADGRGGGGVQSCVGGPQASGARGNQSIPAVVPRLENNCKHTDSLPTSCP